MSGDEDAELEGEDEMSVRDHFAPVWRSLKRTVTSRSIQAYAISFVGIVVLSASIGPAIIGGYATMQENFGLCGTPVLTAESPEATADRTMGEEALPNPTTLAYEELSPATQQAFRTALDVPNHEQKVQGTVDHLSTLEGGAIVTYHGTEHYVVVETKPCVPYGIYPLPLSIVGLIVGVGIVAIPRVSKRFRGES